MEESLLEGLMARIDQAFAEGDPAVADKAREQTNVHAIKEIYRGFATSDFGHAVKHMTADIDLAIVGPEGAPLVGSWRGRADVEAALQCSFQAIDDQCPELLALVAQGDAVIIQGRETGVLKATGKPYETDWTHWFTFREGQVCRLRETAEFSRLIEAARA